MLSLNDVRDIGRGYLRRKMIYIVTVKMHAARLIEFVAMTALERTWSAPELEFWAEDVLVASAEKVEVARSDLDKVEETISETSGVVIGPRCCRIERCF